jgi:thymidylate synthase
MQSIHIVEENLPLAWEKAVIETWNVGDRFPTEYDKDDDPNSRDVTAVIHVTNPMSEPRIHRSFPGGLDDLEKYRSEVLYGVHDHWIDPSVGKWEYTYHERLRDYLVPGVGQFDQIEGVIRRLKNTPHTRRAQAVTYQVWNDMDIDDPTCLQRMWFRCETVKCPDCVGGAILIDGEPMGRCKRCRNGKIDRLNMNMHIRSNDAYKAGFMNMHAFVELQAQVAEAIGAEVGHYIHIADSFHIYGSYFEEFEGFLQTIENREWEDRVYTSDFANDFFIEGCDALLAEEDMPEDKRKLIEQRKEYLICLQKS